MVMRSSSGYLERLDREIARKNSARQKAIRRLMLDKQGKNSREAS